MKKVDEYEEKSMKENFEDDRNCRNFFYIIDNMAVILVFGVSQKGGICAKPHGSEYCYPHSLRKAEL